MVCPERLSEALKRYQLATGDGRYLAPWDRQNVVSDFMRSERRRLLEVAAWRNGFEASENGSAQKEISMYVVPVEASPALRAAVAGLDGWVARGLAALRSSATGLLTALFPLSGKMPKDYSFIRITGSRRTVLYEQRSGLSEHAIAVEKWEYADSASLYRGLDYERGILSKIINENLPRVPRLTTSLQAPLFGAPYVPGGLGGVAFSSFTVRRELIEEIGRMADLSVPPEFRDGRPPDILWKGTRFTHSDHLKFRLAERPQHSDCALSTIGTAEYNDIRKQWLRRTRFPGDYSVFSTVHAFGDGTPAVLKSMLLDFNRTEVAYPKDLGDDIDLEELARIEGSFTEDIWLQNVAVRALAPVAGSEGLDVKFQNILLADMDSLFIDEFRGERERGLLARYILPAGNLRRLAQSVARMSETKSLEEEHYKKARGVIVDNLTIFIKTKEFKNIRYRLESRHADLRHTAIETVLADGQVWTSAEIFDGLNTEGLFRDLLDLEEMLGWMMKKGFIVRDGQDRYRWVGQVG